MLIVENYVDKIVLNTSCSLLHVPYTLDNEKKLEEDKKKYLGFVQDTIRKEYNKILEWANRCWKFIWMWLSSKNRWWYRDISKPTESVGTCVY